MALFDDGETISYILIGNFTQLEVAESIKEKWLNFFNRQQQHIFEEPQDWNPKEDNWLSKHHETEWSWQDSFEYWKRLGEYVQVKQFVQIDINPLSINQEVFLDKNFNDPLLTLMKQWDRDHKLNQLT